MYLISKFDQVLEQLHVLFRDIEEFKWDAGVTIMVNDGKVDVRGLGVTDTPAAASALLFMALKSLPPVTQDVIVSELQKVMERSELVAKEAPLWRGKEPMVSDFPTTVLRQSLGT